MRILTALTYYRPHVSGLTIYAERLARALVRRGHTVTVLTSQYERSLPRLEQMEGVGVIRVPVAARVSKGVLMPTIGLVATKLVLANDAIILHLPQLEASGIALRARLLRKPTVLTYHSELTLPKSPLSAVVERVVVGSNHVAAMLANVLCAYTEDFARHSRLLSAYLAKVRYILPPVAMPLVGPNDADAWRASHGINAQTPVVGVACRLAADKGIEFLLEALPRLRLEYPNLRVLHAGPVDDVVGEERYRQRVGPILRRFSDFYTCLGTLQPDEMAKFFSNCDVHVLPSVNSTETFGLVQIEAALCGTPTVASALPGVRVPTQMTGMGLTVPPRDPVSLANGILEVLAEPTKFLRPRGPIAAEFSPDVAAERYEGIFRELNA